MIAITLLITSFLLPTAHASLLQMPVDKAKVRTNFGRNQDKISNGVTFHISGTENVKAAAMGKVAFSGRHPKYGLFIVIDHGKLLSVYAQLSKSKAYKGQSVKQLQTIGEAKDSLYFEVRRTDGFPLNPLRMIKTKSGKKYLSEKEIANLLLSTGFPPQTIDTMVCVAHFESSHNPKAINVNKNKSYDIGLFQINDINHRYCGIKDRRELYDPKANTRCALIVFKRQGFRAWYGWQHNQKTCNSYKVS